MRRLLFPSRVFSPFIFCLPNWRAAVSIPSFFPASRSSIAAATSCDPAPSYIKKLIYPHKRFRATSLHITGNLSTNILTAQRENSSWCPVRSRCCFDACRHTSIHLSAPPQATIFTATADSAAPAHRAAILAFLRLPALISKPSNAVQHKIFQQPNRVCQCWSNCKHSGCHFYRDAIPVVLPSGAVAVHLPSAAALPFFSIAGGAAAAFNCLLSLFCPTRNPSKRFLTTNSLTHSNNTTEGLSWSSNNSRRTLIVTRRTCRRRCRVLQPSLNPAHIAWRARKRGRARSAAEAAATNHCVVAPSSLGDSAEIAAALSKKNEHCKFDSQQRQQPLSLQQQLVLEQPQILVLPPVSLGAEHRKKGFSFLFPSAVNGTFVKPMTTSANTCDSCTGKIADRGNGEAGEYLVKHCFLGRLNKPEIVFVLGGPGAGKGTQCSLLKRNFQVYHISAGQCLREERERVDSQHGALIDQCIRNGKIVPVAITMNLLLKKMVSLGWAQLFLIDGFPRNEDNLEGWKHFTQKNVLLQELLKIKEANPSLAEQCDAASEAVLQQRQGRVAASQTEPSILSSEAVHVWFCLFLDCPEEKLKERVVARGVASLRSDDTAAAIVKRMQTFTKETMPIVNYFKQNNKLKTVDAAGSIGQVWTAVSAIFEGVEKNTNPEEQN